MVLLSKVIPVYFQNRPEDPQEHPQKSQEDQDQGEAEKYEFSICRGGSVLKEPSSPDSSRSSLSVLLPLSFQA